MVETIVMCLVLVLSIFVARDIALRALSRSPTPAAESGEHMHELMKRMDDMEARMEKAEAAALTTRNSVVDMKAFLNATKARR